MSNICQLPLTAKRIKKNLAIQSMLRQFFMFGFRNVENAVHCHNGIFWFESSNCF